MHFTPAVVRRAGLRIVAPVEFFWVLAGVTGRFVCVAPAQATDGLNGPPALTDVSSILNFCPDLEADVKKIP
jgi:hypothetical protein